jgi:hypothetical protein
MNDLGERRAWIWSFPGTKTEQVLKGKAQNNGRACGHEICTTRVPLERERDTLVVHGLAHMVAAEPDKNEKTSRYRDPRGENWQDLQTIKSRRMHVQEKTKRNDTLNNYLCQNTSC